MNSAPQFSRKVNWLFISPFVFQMTKEEQIKELNAQLEELTGKVAVLMAEKVSASAAIQKVNSYLV